ncbi:MAG: hypothetical protein GYA24_25180 [Candidatus Lokiarchaeota archaeon]|nr:hypothetical protein [Candidatus Lokiarchaeota archaeon]
MPRFAFTVQRGAASGIASFVQGRVKITALRDGRWERIHGEMERRYTVKIGLVYKVKVTCHPDEKRMVAGSGSACMGM